MSPFLLTAMSGWLAVTAFTATLILPLGAKGLRIAGRPRKRFMALHFTLGTALPFVGLAHAAIPMSVGALSGLRGLGLAFATAALFLLFLQGGLGISLRSNARARPLLRSMHFATMLALAALIAVHILINQA